MRFAMLTASYMLCFDDNLVFFVHGGETNVTPDHDCGVSSHIATFCCNVRTDPTLYAL
jgi:hypothetical protein